MSSAATRETAASQRAAAGVRHSLATLKDEVGIPVSSVVTKLMGILDALAADEKAKRHERKALEIDKLTAPRDFRAANQLAAYEAAKSGGTFTIGPDPTAEIAEHIAALGAELVAIRGATQLANTEVSKELATDGTLGNLAEAWAAVFSFEPGPDTTYSETGANAVKAQVLRDQGQSIALVIEAYLEGGGVMTEELSTLKKHFRKSTDAVMPSLAALREETRSRAAATPAAQDAVKRSATKVEDREQSQAEAASAAAARVGVKGADVTEKKSGAKGTTKGNKTKDKVPA